MRDKSTVYLIYCACANRLYQLTAIPNCSHFNSAAMATGLPSASARAKVAPPPVPTRGHSSHQASSQGVPVPQNVGMPMHNVMVMPLAPQPVSPAPPMELKAAPGGVPSSRGRPAAAQAPHAHTVVESQFGGISGQPPVLISQQQLLQPIPPQSTTFAGSSVPVSSVLIEVQTFNKVTIAAKLLFIIKIAYNIIL